jgi:hypothetical protein
MQLLGEGWSFDRRAPHAHIAEPICEVAAVCGSDSACGSTLMPLGEMRQQSFGFSQVILTAGY